MKKGYLTTIAMLLIFATIFGLYKAPITVYAEKSKPQLYISDIKVGYDQDSSGTGSNRAKEALKNQGYEIVDNDLNKGTGKGYSYIGYKTTQNKDEAITDLKIMDMNGGYKKNNYYDMLKQVSGSVNERAAGLVIAAKEFKSNVDGGSKVAIWAYNMLNHLVVSTDGNSKLGDYLLSEKRAQVDFYDIVLKCDPSVLKFVLSMFALGVADYKESTWLSRMSELDASVPYNAKLYSDRAQVLLPNVQSFNQACQNASKKVEYDDDGNPTNLDTLSQDEQTEYLRVFSLYETLNGFEYGDAGIGDRFVKEDSALTEDVVYPLIDALTDGQYAMMCLVGFDTLASNLGAISENVDETIKKADEQVNTVLDKIDGTDLWANIVQNVLEDKEIAITDQAERMTIAQGKVNALTKPNSFMEELENYFSIASTAVTVGLAMAQISWGIMATSFGAGSFGFIAMFHAVGTAFMTSIGGAITATIFTAGMVVLVVAIIVLIVIISYKIYKFFKSDDVVYTDIPIDMYDATMIKDSHGDERAVFLPYKVALDQNDRAADLNCWQGKSWIALYYSKDSDAGSPLLAPSEGENINDFIKVQYKNSNEPDGMTPLTKFGEVNAFNTNFNANKGDQNGNYVFFKTLEARKNLGNGEYVADLLSSEADNMDTAAAILIAKGFTPIYKNLNASCSDKVAIIGYKTTNSKVDAIKDIRVQQNFNSSQVFVGSSSYSSAGTFSNMTLYYSKMDSAGTPIYADFIVTDTRPETMPDGYEGVCFLAGGPAANVAIGSSHESPLVDYTSFTQAYILFKTGIKYDGEEYVSGYAFFSHRFSYKQKDILEKQYGYKSINDDMDDQYYRDISFCISTSKNPYRAITDVQSLFFGDFDGALPTEISQSGLGYNAVPVFELTWKQELYGPYITVLTLNTDNSYYIDQNRHALYTTTNITANTEKTTKKVKDEETGKEVEKTEENKTIEYNGTRMKENEIILTENSKYSKEGYHGVRDMLSESYSAANLKSGDRKDDSLYMFLPGDIQKRGKYIKSIKIDGSSGEEKYSRIAVLKTGGENIRVNSKDSTYFYDNGNGQQSISKFYSSMGFEYTDDTNEVIRDVKLVPFAVGGSSIPESIKYDGMTYKRCSTVPCGFNENEIACGSSSYTTCYGAYVYATTNIAAGTPITDIQARYNTDSLSGYDNVGYVLNVDGALQENKLFNEGFWFTSLFIKREEKQTKYIANLYATHDKSESRATKINTFYGADTVFDQDFNSWNGGDYVYLGYDKTNTPSDAITGLRVVRQENYYGGNTLEFNGITYTMVGNHTDFNAGAGGHYIHLFYTKDPKAGNPLTELKITDSPDANGWDVVRETIGYFSFTNVKYNYPLPDNWYFPANFNGGADYWFIKPDFIYLHYKRATGNFLASVIGNVGPATYVTISIFAVAFISATSYGAYYKRKKSKKGKKEILK